ncbi:hypothetical protein [uncultured Anaerovibrio sp.]|uniref:hypothetical protein n=1 Tax=uncultured Anaerovibrio sp. TaxID=361586 RepID=UPI0025EF3EF0|nr:hypothetical protein [uncultured Anaerovibrio sp.]
MLQKRYTVFKDVSYPEEKWEELVGILNDIKTQFTYHKGKFLYIHLIFHRIPQSIVDRIRSAIRTILPQAVVTGMPETVFAEKKENSYLIINANIYLKTDLKILSYNGMPDDYEALGRQIGEEIAGVP